MSSFKDTKCYIMCFANADDANLLIDILEMHWQIKVWLISEPFDKDPKLYNKTVIFNLGFRIRWETLMSKLGSIKDKITYCQHQPLMVNLNNADEVIEKVKKNLSICFRGDIQTLDIDLAIANEQKYQKRPMPIDEPKPKNPRF